MITPSNKAQQIKNADDQISLRELVLKMGAWWHYILSKWKIIAIAVILGAIAGLVYSFIKKPSYKASMSFVLEEQKGGGGSLGSMSDLASLVGINLGGAEGAGLFTGDNIMEFIKSKRIITKTLLTKVNIEGKEQLLINRYVKANDLDKKWAKNPRLSGFHFISDTSSYFLQDSLLSAFQKAILKNNLVIRKPDKKLTIIQLDITSTDELFAKAFCEALIQNVTDFYVETRTKKSAENLAILTKQVDSVRHELNSAIGGVAAATQANPNPNAAFQMLRVPSQRIQVDVQANTAILSELVKQQELAKLNLRNDKPLIQSLDVPTLPLEKSKIGKMLGMFLGAFLAGFIVVLSLSVRRIYLEIMQADKAYG